MEANPSLESNRTQDISIEEKDRRGWIDNEVVKTRFGEFEFKNGYPTKESIKGLSDQLFYNRAIEVYLTQMTAVSMAAVRNGLREFGAKKYNQFVIWESLMGAETLMLTANTETVYGMGCLNLKNEGPIVVEAPPKMLGGAQDMLQRFLVDIGPLGPDKGKGGKYLFLPPGYTGKVPEGYFVVKSPTYGIWYAVRGFQVDGKTDEAVSLMKQIKVYPLAEAKNPVQMEFLNGSKQKIDTVFSETVLFFEQLSQLVNEEPGEIFTPLENFYMCSIGIERGKPFAPSTEKRLLLEEAIRAASALARVNFFASIDPETFFYPDRKWQGLVRTPYTFLKDGALLLNLRDFVYYMAIGNSPAMTEKHVGAGSQYLWSYRDREGDFLEGAKTYKLNIPAHIPINNFWSVVVYDSLSRSELKSSQPFPSVGMYGHPKANQDGSIDIYFGPTQPLGKEENWIQTVPGKGWFPIVRFYGPLEPYFDQTWKLNDIEKEESPQLH